MTLFLPLSKLLIAGMLVTGFPLSAELLLESSLTQTATELPVPSKATWPQFIEAARKVALQYIAELPNFICIQTTKRYMPRYKQTMAPPSQSEWILEDQITEELIYNDHKESYKLLKIDRRTGGFMSSEGRRGASSTGEFGSLLESLFQPSSRTDFQMGGIDKIHGRKTVRAKYSVARENSSRELKYLLEGKLLRTIKSAYRGNCWIDIATGQVVKLDLEDIDIPASFPMTKSSVAVEYGLIDIAGGQQWLPIRAESQVATGNNLELPPAERFREARNVIEFKDYRKFETEVKILP